mmetsp:Transcript_6466/g.14180  ORF Transcript_6466/g.14180 Transcript_6466/m.14180 type:complete len:226 (-) Transcript_6466:72-749(-)
MFGGPVERGAEGAAHTEVDVDARLDESLCDRLSSVEYGDVQRRRPIFVGDVNICTGAYERGDCAGVRECRCVMQRSALLSIVCVDALGHGCSERRNGGGVRSLCCGVQRGVLHAPAPHVGLVEEVEQGRGVAVGRRPMQRCMSNRVCGVAVCLGIYENPCHVLCACRCRPMQRGPLVVIPTSQVGVVMDEKLYEGRRPQTTRQMQRLHFPGALCVGIHFPRGEEN